MAEQMKPMPDVPERCPFCNSGDRREETWRGSPAYSFSCGTVFYANGEVALRYFACEKEGQLAAARAEAERWRKQYEALRAKVESVAQELRKRAYSCAKDWLETGHHYHDGASDAYYMAEEMVWRLLSEAGGGDQ